MKRSLQRPLPPMEVQRLDAGAVEGPKNGPDSDLVAAKAQIGRAVAHVLRVTDAPLKELGDPSRVQRVCEGDVSSVIARAFQLEPYEFVSKLAKESGAFDFEVSMRRRAS